MENKDLVQRQFPKGRFIAHDKKGNSKMQAFANMQSKQQITALIAHVKAFKK